MSSASSMATELTKLQQSNLSEIKTPQELVHIKHRISLLQYKYWILMLRTYRELYEEGERFGPGDFCYLSMAGVAEAIGYQPKTKELEEDLEKIRQEPIFFNVLEKDGEKAKRGQGFISEWHVSSNRVGVVFPPVLRHAVENLDRKDSIFHLLNWHIFNSFTGKYEAILYKLCKDFVGVGWTKKFSLEQFRDYMGIGPEEYPDFKRLNQWCISGPVKKINESELSDVIIEPVFTREKRRVVEIQFRVAYKRQTVLDFGDDPAFRFAKVRITPSQQRKYLAGRDPETVELSIRRANEYAEEKERKGETVDIQKVYAKAISENWGDEYREKLKVAEEKAERSRKKARAEEAAAAGDKLRAEFEAEWKGRADAALEALGEDSLRQMFETWKDEANPPSVMLKKGTDSVPFRIWARERVLPKPQPADFDAWRASNASQAA